MDVKEKKEDDKGSMAALSWRTTLPVQN